MGAKAPEWYLNPSFDSAKLYGLGEGENPTQAKQNAMIDLANSLQSSIQTNFEQQTKRLKSDLVSSASQTINIQTKIIDLLNLEVTKSQCNQGRCYTQIEIPRSKLLEQLEQKIKEALQEIKQNNSPFRYSYQKEIVYPKMLQNYALYIALGGSKLELPKGPERPTFDLEFQYNGNFSADFKNVLEKTIQDYITQLGAISPQSDWKILINLFRENQSILLNLSAIHRNQIIHHASISDHQKSTISIAFFAKRLGVQTYKKIQKWETSEE